MADRIGQQLGNYRLTRLLGWGSFADVYLGEHIDLGTMVAIKILHTLVAGEDVAQFRQEARILANLRHPQIVRVFDFGLYGKTPYLVMDYAPNGTLRTRHAQGTRLPISLVVSYVKQIAQALQYAHERKVVHRDIKPENMLIGEHGEILLSDFGIALIAQSSRYQSTKDMAGTITYMAPEQIAAHPRPASDQYSLGILVYEWLCGTPPFQGSYTEIAIKHSTTPPPLLREHLPTLSPYVEQVILVALAKQPEERFASVGAFAAALEQASQYKHEDRAVSPGAVVQSQTKATPLPVPLRKTSSPPKSRPLHILWLMCSVLSIISVFALGFALFTWFYVKPVGRMAYSSAFNNVGVSDDAYPTRANFDGSNDSYSKQALIAAGLHSGAEKVSDGVTFHWPTLTDGVNDNWLVNGQTHWFNTQGTTLAFLGAAASGPSSGTAVITYTDNSTQSFTLAFGDWTLNNSTSEVLPGNKVVAHMSYRNTPEGKQPRNVYVFFTLVALQTGKTVEHITLPTSVNQGTLHVFAVAIR